MLFHFKSVQLLKHGVVFIVELSQGTQCIFTLRFLKRYLLSCEKADYCLLSYQVMSFQSCDSWKKSPDAGLETSHLGVTLLLIFKSLLWPIFASLTQHQGEKKPHCHLIKREPHDSKFHLHQIPHSWCKLRWHPQASTRSCCKPKRLPEQNICRLVASFLKPSQLHDSRLTFHLIRLLSCRPTLLSNSSRITSSLRIWATLVSAISSTDKCTPANLAVEIRSLWSARLEFSWQGLCFGY